VQGLDTGVVYYVRAYGIGNSKAGYSANQIIGKLSPVISYADSALSYGRTFTIITNMANIDTSSTKILLNNTPVHLATAGMSNVGAVFTADFSTQLTPGKYTLSVSVGGLTIAYSKKVTIMEGTWKKIGDVTFAYPWVGGRFMDGFIVGDWIYNSGLVGNATGDGTVGQFYKYNYKTGAQAVLKNYDSGIRSILLNSTAVGDGNLVHVLGGQFVDPDYKSISKHYIYNTSTDSWTQEEDLPGGPRQSTVTFIYNRKIYFGLGYRYANNDVRPIEEGKYYTDFYCYDLSTKKWQRLADFPDANGRFRNASFIVGSKIYVTAGITVSQPNKTTWCYDIVANTWTKKASFPGAADVNYYNFSVGNYGYVGGGTAATYDSFFGPTHFVQCYKYDPANDRWTEVSNPAIYNNYPISASGEFGIVAGGVDDNSQPLTAIYKYTP
jgi:hypothetical protein